MAELGKAGMNGRDFAFKIFCKKEKQIHFMVSVEYLILEQKKENDEA